MIRETHVEALIFCEHLYQEREGKFILAGIIADIRVKDVPFMVPTFGVYLCIRGVTGGGKVELVYGVEKKESIENQARRIIATWTMPPDVDPDFPVELATQFTGLKIDSIERHEFVVTLGGKEIANKKLSVEKIKAPTDEKGIAG